MVSEKTYYIYLMTNWNHRVMYVGVTNDLVRRVYEHKNKLMEGFTSRYNIKKLVYFENTGDIHTTLAREKEIKRWRRDKKDALVQALNSDWRDLSEDF